MGPLTKSYNINEKEYPSLIKSLEERAPDTIYVKGNYRLIKELDDNRRGIAVIGSRNVDDSYYESTKKFFQDYLTTNDWIVVSGLAKGSDTFGHRLALEFGLRTIAILGPGVERIYPKENERIAEEILENEGALLSENAPDFYPRQKFEFAKCLVERDRIQAALSSGIFIVEAGEISGTWHAVSWAIRLNKPIFTYEGTFAHKILSRYLLGKMDGDWLAKYKIKPYANKKTNIYFINEEFNNDNFAKIMGNPILKKHNSQTSLDVFQ